MLQRISREHRQLWSLGMMLSFITAVSVIPLTRPVPIDAAGPCTSPAQTTSHQTRVHDKQSNRDYGVSLLLNTQHDQRADGCYRSYHMMVVVSDVADGARSAPDPQSVHFHIRAWVCGQRRPELDLDETGTNIQSSDSQYANYGSGPCGPQADNVGSDAYNPNWTPSHVYGDARIP